MSHALLKSRHLRYFSAALILAMMANVASRLFTLLAYLAGGYFGKIPLLRRAAVSPRSELEIILALTGISIILVAQLFLPSEQRDSSRAR